MSSSEFALQANLSTDNRPMTRTLAFVMSVLLPAAFATAHAGHGTTDPGSPSHYVFEPVHAVLLIAVLLGGLLMIWGTAKLARRWSR